MLFTCSPFTAWLKRSCVLLCAHSEELRSSIAPSRVQAVLVLHHVLCAMRTYVSLVCSFLLRCSIQFILCGSLHMNVSCAALLWSVYVGCDAVLIVCALLIGESANPLRLITQLLTEHLNDHTHFTAATTKRTAALQRWQMYLSTAHFVWFVASRFIALQYTMHVIWPLAQSHVTRLAACGLLLVSAGALYEYTRVGGGVQSSFPSSASASFTSQRTNINTAASDLQRRSLLA